MIGDNVLHMFPDMPMGAVVDGDYRYLLWRGRGPAVVTWIMLNPSTADAMRDDPTIRKVKKFSSILVGGQPVRVVVVNLYALRSTSPKGLHRRGFDVEGPWNRIHVGDALAAAHHVVVAWGANEGPTMAARVAATVAQVEFRHKKKPLCLGTTASGAPCHPLMLPYATPFREWSPQ